MDLRAIIGSNIKAYRNIFGYTQDHLAKFLGIDRSTISYYERGEREISVIHLEKLADLFCVDIDNLVENNPELRKADLAFAFRKDGLDDLDLKSIADFQKVVKNYIKIVKLAKGE
jgi:transcriptional regulator with XRE-family HTH domain